MTADRIAQAVEYAQALALAGFGIVEAYAPAGLGTCTCRAGADCESPGKHPVGDEWQKRATRSPHTIGQIVRRREGQYGVIPWPGERGLILDVDRADALPVKLPASLRVKSGKPGHGHAYFRLPAGYNAATLPASAAWGEVRVEGASRHVIGPWSRHGETGAVYTPTGTPDAIAELPADVLAQLAPPAQLTIRTAAATVEGPITAGERDNTLTSIAGTMRRRGMSEGAILAALRAENDARCVPPLPAADLERIARSVGRYPPGEVETSRRREEAEPPARALTPFATGAELAADAPAEHEYVVRPYLALGALHELDGKPKTAGKTTLLLHLIAAVLDGARFLGEPTMRTPVVLLSEQSRRSLAPTLRSLRLARPELLVLTWPDATGSSWAAIVEAAVAECRRIGARLLVIDTLTPFVGLGAEMENDASAALAAMRPLQAAAQDDALAVLVSRHDRKSGGDVAESGRGSNAWSGAVDCVMALRRQPNPVRPSIRELEAISRRGDVPDDPVLVELTDAGYVLLGEPAAVAFSEALRGVLEFLSAEQDEASGGMSLDEMAEALDMKRATLQAAVKALLEAGQIVRTGAGKRGSPYLYAKPAPRAAATTPPNGSLVPSVSVSATPIGGRTETETPSGTDAGLLAKALRVFGDDVASVSEVGP